MKRFVAFFLSICCITLLLSGCKQPPVDGPDNNTSGQFQDAQPTTQPTQPTVQATEPVIVEDIEGPLAQYVQTAIKEKYQRFDKYGYGTVQQESSLRIPKLFPFSEDAIAVQKEIDSALDSYITEVRKNYAEDLSAATSFIDYKAYLNNTVFSLVIQAQSMFDLSFYLVYNFDIETGKQLDTKGLMSKLQITDYTEKFTQIAQDAFDEDHVNATDEYLNEHYDLYITQMTKNTSKENIDKAMPYIADDGKVMVVLNIYSTAGAEYYPEIFPVS